MNTTRMPMIHARLTQRGCQTGPPWVRARMAFTVWVIGLLRANAWSHEGIVCTGTNAELAKINGKTQTNPAAWAASGSRTLMPMNAEIHENARPNRTARPRPAMAG